MRPKLPKEYFFDYDPDWADEEAKYNFEDFEDFEEDEEEDEEEDWDRCGCSDPGCPCDGPKRGGPP